VSYRSADSHRFDKLCAGINEMKKEVTKREHQKKEMADVVDQDNLVEIRGRRPHKLPDIFLVKPKFIRTASTTILARKNSVKKT
jgi:nucleosome binding factor SPN SPT16 subunit